MVNLYNKLYVLFCFQVIKDDEATKAAWPGRQIWLKLKTCTSEHPLPEK